MVTEAVRAMRSVRSHRSSRTESARSVSRSVSEAARSPHIRISSKHITTVLSRIQVCITSCDCIIAYNLMIVNSYFEIRSFFCKKIRPTKIRRPGLSNKSLVESGRRGNHLRRRRFPLLPGSSASRTAPLNPFLGFRFPASILIRRCLFDKIGRQEFAAFHKVL